ncbi:unnamed protein product [Psylliodes chrysocephalus]|uniref:long-chain-fatty-acid--CoA ligase n=1 Tax=Psylliodes chrysocephalus TaxID=3402493 RepID=A0A9P0GCU0_9CUCU|nr:unnamed protein product [Psylliodes chrysocephala]
MPSALSIEYNWFFSLLYGFIFVVVFIFDVLTFPIYFILQNPIKNMKLSKIKRSTIIDRGNDYMTIKTTKKPFDTHKEIERENIKTMTELFEHAVKKYKEKRCLGTRQIIGEEDEEQPNGRLFKKYILGDYNWLSFTDVDRLASLFGKGLRELGNKPQQPIAILAETQARWMIAAQAAFKNSVPLVTIYATLGEEAIAHAINETEVSVVITSFALLPKFKKILNLTPNVKTIIYMEDQLETLKNKDGFKVGVNILGFDEVLHIDTNTTDQVRPTPDDIAIIMYTSGSTGVPKGVKLLHRNLIASIKAFTDCTKLYKEEVVMGYLPLAHVFELLVESGVMYMGMKIGYSSALTMIDTASKIKRGTKGDASMLKPTFTCCVPLILDRIAKAVLDKVEKSSGIKKVMFKFGYNYKNRWRKIGFSTPLTDKIIFQATRNIMGGHLHVMAVGGAPLTADTHELIRTCLCIDALQGYGLTETCACASNQDKYDLQYERVGSPMTTALIRIINWEEGNYYITDKPNPRGEIVIGGGIVSPGYYKNDEKTKEEFFEDKDTWWFRTGDIGEIHPDGSIKIIDRKKDLVKLQAGEYVSLGKVEALLSTNALVDSICVYAESTKSYCIALVVANPDNLKKLAAGKLNITNKTFEQLCDDKEVNKIAYQVIVDHSKKVKLEKFEIPEKIKLVKEIWTPETGLVTATFKLKRKEIQKFYAKDLKEIYA